MITSQTLRQESDQPRKCFVVGPIGDPHAAHGSPEREAYEHHLGIFEQVIAPACEKYGISAVRADGIAHAGDINEQICRHVVESDLVVADVSGGNPNVMYELGLRHITGKPTIHIGEAGQLPFDIASIRTIRYQRKRSHLAEARKEIESALEAGLRDGFELLTPARVLRGLQTGDGTAYASEVGDDGKGDDEDLPGLLDDFAVIEDGLDEMAADMESITKTVETIGTLTEQSGTEMLDLTQANAPMSARLAAVARYAETISAPAGELNTVAAVFAERMTTMDSGVRAALGLIEMTPPDERGEGVEEFLEQLMSLDEAAQEGLAQITSFGTSAGGLARVSRHLRKPVKEISAAVKQLTFAITRMGEWAAKARALAHSATA
jgi:nucleoside 2-deoxyribosyltransferase